MWSCSRLCSLTGEKAIERNLLIPSGVAHLGGGGDQARELGGQHRSSTQAAKNTCLHLLGGSGINCLKEYTAVFQSTHVYENLSLACHEITKGCMQRTFHTQLRT